ncbi:MAG TPA: HAMP domain-containing protein [Gammaproteobacteria bacterium]
MSSAVAHPHTPFSQADEMTMILAALTALKRGDPSARLPLGGSPTFHKIADVFNDLAEQSAGMAEEIRRLAKVVGRQGKLDRRATLPGARGIWDECVEQINSLIDDLVHPTTEAARVIGAVAQGDLSQTMALEHDGRPLEGEFLRTARTINRMVEQLANFSAEVTRVVREVGTEGKLGVQAKVRGVAGTWKDVTDSVNSMAGNLTSQVRNIANVTKAVAGGDLSKKVTVDAKGEILELKNTINTMVDQLRSFASEVTRVAREVGTEGKLGGQADVRGVAGTWKDLTESVNLMASNLTSQVRNIAEVTKAVAAGDLSKKITVDVKGEVLELKSTINTMVDQLRSFASEVTRVAREVGTEGQLGGQAEVEGVSGTWRDLTESVNAMAGNLTAQVRNIAEVTKAVAAGNLSRKITVDVKGEILELKNTINTMVDQLSSFASEVTRVAREVGSEGILGGQARVAGVSGTWKDLTESVNFMAGNLTSQVRNIAEVTTAVAAGDLSKKITVDVKGEILELKNTINTMVDQLRSFASEVTRVAREVGTEGKLGGQADVRGVAGVWKDLTDNVNFMAGNLTSQVRGIAKVVTAVANGDLKQKLTVEAKGEIAALAETINSMTETLATFADQVTTVAREVGVEGKLGGQAKVPGAAGIWKGLTENVNELAANLTTQVRAIAEVATAVTQGDLTREITVETQGEVAALKDTINEMIRNLRDTTRKNTEQDWLKTNLAKFSRMLQGQRDLVTVGQMILSELAPVVGAQQAEFYVLTGERDRQRLKLLASFASNGKAVHGKEIELGEGLVGQCAIEKRKILLTNVVTDAFRIRTGLSESSAHALLVMPVVFEGELRGVIELASLEPFSHAHEAFLDQLTESIGIVINTIEANTRTEDLLKQSQSLAEELKQTNQELEEKARQLAHQNQEVERKNQEVEQARQALEEKAKQLALTSKYKSEFLANMSHELRTPLNSLLLLSDQLSKNKEGNLTARQVEAAKTIHASGNDLLALINDILDLSKIESGTVMVDVSELRLLDLQRYVERTFRHVAESKQVGFEVHLDPSLPRSMFTDIKRMQQIIKNLLSNAFKFTHQGRVSFTVAPAASGWSPDNEDLEQADTVIAFSVSDTGIGIPADKQQIIFEAFQQADGSTSRKYGGTGLGLAISRELSKLLAGEIRLTSTPGEGSTFTLYLPTSHPQRTARTGRVPVLALPPVSPDVRFEPLPAAEEEDDAAPAPNEAGDDRADIKRGDRVLLIVADELAFAKMLLDVARERGFKGLVSGSGAGAIAMVQEHRPAAIALDTALPDMSGWRVLNRLKADLATRHIPICLMSTDDSRAQALHAGAVDFLAKPVAEREALASAVGRLHDQASRPRPRLALLMAPGPDLDAVLARLAGADVDTVVSQDGEEIRAALRDGHLDCLVVEPGTADLEPDDVLDVLERKERKRPLAIAIYGAGAGELARWRGGDGVFALREARSPEGLLDVIYLFLHRSLAELSDEERRRTEELHRDSRVLAGKKALIVDDDMRNIFALSTVLHDQGMQMVSASNGREAIRLVQDDRSIDIVLMDIMMPEMDGMTTMREIRKLPHGKDLPIVAVTAKAMKGDRDKCIEAGAWDYLSKPVDTQHLLAVLKGWLQR